MSRRAHVVALTDASFPKLTLRLDRVLETLRLWLGGKPCAVQVAALPWRRRLDGGVEILLATSRDTGRWVLPKGWPHKKLSLAGSAAQEAWEETGFTGVIGERALGSFFYLKGLDNGLDRRVRVQVFALRVSGQADDWPEKGQREMRWFRPEEAADFVQEPELSALLRNKAVFERLV
jgi:8-oxo-dGTP pyrophosphatase MutT (NUDIX family)